MVEISSGCFFKILQMKFDQDLCLNLRYDFGMMNSNLGSVVPLAMFYLYSFFFVLFYFVSLNVFVVPPLPTGLSTWLPCATFSDYFSDVALCQEWKIHSSAQIFQFIP